MIRRDAAAGPRILIVDDEECIRYTFCDFLNAEGFETWAVEGYEGALELLDERDFDLVFVDIILGGKTGLDLLPRIKEVAPETEVIIITGAPTVTTATQALRMGAMDYIVKPVRQDTLLRVTSEALERMSARALTS